MSEDLNFEDLCNLVALKVGCRATPSSVGKYLIGLYKVILNQLKLNKKIYIKDFGYFEIKERKSGERVIYDPNTGTKQLVYVEPKYSISFRPSETFYYSVNENNFRLITKKRLKLVKPKKTKKKNKRIKNSADLINKAEKRKG